MDLPHLHTQFGELTILPVEQAQLMVDYYHRNRQHLAKWEPLRTEQFYQLPHWQQELQQRIEGFSKGDAIHLVALDSKQVVACINFTKINANNSHGCFLGYSIDEAHQGKGKMQSFLLAALDYLFKTWQVPRVTAGYIPYNHRSGALLKRLEFAQIGTAQEYLKINGRMEDHIITVKHNPYQHQLW